MENSSTPKTLLRVQVMLEQSIKLQCQIIADQDRLVFEQVHNQALQAIEEQVMKLIREREDNW